MVYHRQLGLARINNQCTKLDASIYTRNEDMKGAANVQNVVVLGVTQGHRQCYHLTESIVMISYSTTTVKLNMRSSCTVFEI